MIVNDSKKCRLCFDQTSFLLLCRIIQNWPATAYLLMYLFINAVSGKCYPYMYVLSGNAGMSMYSMYCITVFQEIVSRASVSSGNAVLSMLFLY